MHWWWSVSFGGDGNGADNDGDEDSVGDDHGGDGYDERHVDHNIGNDKDEGYDAHYIYA